MFRVYNQSQTTGLSYQMPNSQSVGSRYSANSTSPFAANGSSASDSAAAAAFGSSSAESPFFQAIHSLLLPDAQGNIHEEEFQYAIAGYLLQGVDPQAALSYQDIVSQVIGMGEPPMSAEDAVKVALKELVSGGLLTVDEAEKINGIAFEAAQLDDNLSALYDNRGGPSDPTIAVMNIDQAIAQAESVLHAFEGGTLEIPARSLDAPSNGVAN